MRKRYSDPLMFPAVLLTVNPLKPSQEGVNPNPDGDYDDDDDANGSKFMLNSKLAPQSSDPLTIVNPVEEAVTSEEIITEESSGAASSAESSPLEASPVIDHFVPDGTASSGVSE